MPLLLPSTVRAFTALTSAIVFILFTYLVCPHIDLNILYLCYFHLACLCLLDDPTICFI
ncbi:hypothetical protein HanIR_Chr17g0853141 [Helianthus annuus]|nr:hypothetical protein HanIR_Chr17g0853141 [Helianthus annuus]